MKRIFAAFLCLCLFLTACGSKPEQTDPSTTPSASDPTTEATTLPTTEATTEATTEPTTVPTTEAPVMYRHPLTGQWLEEPMTTRPVAIVTNNYKAAQPVLGISHADIVFESITESVGEATRMLAIYTDLIFPDQLGTIRSARTYFVSLARVFNAPLVHHGGSSYALSDISSLKYPHFEVPESVYGYRDQARKSSGYSSEHTLVTEGNMLLEGLKKNNIDLTAPADAYYGFDFADDVDLDGETANTITVQFYSTSGKYTTMNYDKNEGVYYGTQKWANKQTSIADGNSGDLVPFKNILILNANTRSIAGVSNRYIDLTGEGTGYFACNGEYVPIQWSRENGSDPFTLTTEDGNPITFGVGKTYVIVRPTRSPDAIFE